MYTTSLRDSAPHCSGILSRSPSALAFWSCVYLTPSCQGCWCCSLRFLPFCTAGSMPLLRCYALVTGCFIRTGGTLRHTPTTTGPGMWWSMTGSTTMHTKTSSGFSRRGSSLPPCWLSSPCPRSCMNTPSLSAWAISTQCSLSSSCSLEWLLTSLSTTAGKGQSGTLWYGLLFSWAMESFCAFILKNGMPASTVLWRIPHFWIMSGRVPGLVGTCFRSLDSASFLANEEWMFFLIPSQSSSAVTEYFYATLFGPLQPFPMTTWSWPWVTSWFFLVCFLLGRRKTNGWVHGSSSFGGFICLFPWFCPTRD